MFDIITKKEFWSWLDRGHRTEKEYTLKGIQDAFILDALSGVKGKRILEIGGGKSRVLTVLAPDNECWNAEPFEGRGAGPKRVDKIKGVKRVSAYLGERSAELPANYFDCVFSVSVVEHVELEELEAFFEDCARVMKTGARMLHAIDLYVFNASSTAPHREATRQTLKRYLSFADRPQWGLKFIEEPKVDENIAFDCAHASNSDRTMYEWNSIAPHLEQVREAAQSVSLKAGWDKREPTQGA